MARTRTLDRPRELLERIPAALRVNRFEPQRPRHHRGNLRSCPQPSVGRRIGQVLGHDAQDILGEDRGLGAVVGALVAEALGTVRVIAGDQPVQPSAREAEQLADLGLAMTLGQQPDRLHMALLDHIRGRAMPGAQLFHAQMW
jgi:hypothetical protein